MLLCQVIESYLRTHRNALSRAHISLMLGRFNAHMGVVDIATIERADIALYLTTLRPGSAHDMAKRIRALLNWAVEMGLLETAPPIRSKYKPRGHTPWSSADIAAFRAHWPPLTLPRLTLELALCTGLRRADLVALAADQNGAPAPQIGSAEPIRTAKTGSTAYIDTGPVRAAYGSPALFAELAAVKPHDLSCRFRRWARRAGLKGRSLHGLRKAFLTRAAEAGCSAHELMVLAGHASPAMSFYYTRSAERARLAKSALEKLAQPLNRPS